MKYSELIKELEYWKETSGEIDPEITIYSTAHESSIEIDEIKPVVGIYNDTAIGIVYF